MFLKCLFNNLLSMKVSAHHHCRMYFLSQIFVSASGSGIAHKVALLIVPFSDYSCVVDI